MGNLIAREITFFSGVGGGGGISIFKMHKTKNSTKSLPVVLSLNKVDNFSRIQS